MACVPGGFYLKSIDKCMKKAFWIPFSGTEKAFYLFLHIYPSDIFHRHPFPGQSYPHLPQILCSSNTAPSASEKFLKISWFYYSFFTSL